MYDVESLKKDLKEILSEKRYEHCLRVADVAKELAKIYNVDIEKAYIAGLIHDIAKEFTDEENTYYINKNNLSKNLLKREYKDVLHALIGSLHLKEKYNIEDDICNAVKVHTTASVNMNMLDKVLFVADKIEPKKEYPGIEEERKLAYINIDKCLILCLENNIKHLRSKGKKFDESIIEILKELLV